jgi:hypothetical protein
MNPSFFQELAKLAEKQESNVDKVVPYVKGFAAGAFPTSFVADKMLALPVAKDQASRWVAEAAKARTVRALVLGGGLLGMGYQHHRLKNQPKTKTVKTASYEVEVPYHQYEIRKVAALAGDLRRLGMGRVKQPPFPTEPSKALANKLLNRSQKPGSFGNVAKPGNLVRPGVPLQRQAFRPR